MFSVHEAEDREYEDGCQYTDWLIARWEALSVAPVRGEDGWSEELEAERDSVRRQIFGPY